MYYLYLKYVLIIFAPNHDNSYHLAFYVQVSQGRKIKTLIF